MATPLNTREGKPRRKATTTGQTIQESAANRGQRVHPSQQPQFSGTDFSLDPAIPTKGTWEYDSSMRVVQSKNSRGERQLIAALFSGTPETHANGRLICQVKTLRSGLLAISRGKKQMLRWLFGIGFPDEIDGAKTEEASTAALSRIIAVYLVGLTEEKKVDSPPVK